MSFPTPTLTAQQRAELRRNFSLLLHRLTVAPRDEILTTRGRGGTNIPIGPLSYQPRSVVHLSNMCIVELLANRSYVTDSMTAFWRYCEDNPEEDPRVVMLRTQQFKNEGQLSTLEDDLRVVTTMRQMLCEMMHLLVDKRQTVLETNAIIDTIIGVNLPAHAELDFEDLSAERPNPILPTPITKIECLPMQEQSEKASKSEIEAMDIDNLVPP